MIEVDGWTPLGNGPLEESWKVFQRSGLAMVIAQPFQSRFIMFDETVAESENENENEGLCTVEELS